MIISGKKSFLFLHVFKVAGSSIRRTLIPFADKRVIAGQSLNYVLKLARLPSLQNPLYSYHPRLVDVRDVLGDARFAELYKFSFVRNPWDWQVSLYHYALQSPRHPQHRLTKSFGGFDGYLEWRIEKELRLQSDFLCDDHGSLLADFVGRFESLDEDFRTVCERLDIPYRLKFINQSERKPYRDYYSDRSRRLVEKAFAADIERFGYAF